MTTVDVAIIGAGPTGLFAVFQCGMQKLRCAVIDALDVVGGQCQALYPEKPIYDIPAWPEISGGDLAAKLKQQAAPFAPEYFLGQTVTGLKEHAGEWHLTTSTGNSITAKAVIIAAGAGAFALCVTVHACVMLWSAKVFGLRAAPATHGRRDH